MSLLFDRDTEKILLRESTKDAFDPDRRTKEIFLFGPLGAGKSRLGTWLDTEVISRMNPLPKTIVIEPDIMNSRLDRNRLHLIKEKLGRELDLDMAQILPPDNLISPSGIVILNNDGELLRCIPNGLDDFFRIYGRNICGFLRANPESHRISSLFYDIFYKTNGNYIVAFIFSPESGRSIDRNVYEQVLANIDELLQQQLNERNMQLFLNREFLKEAKKRYDRNHHVILVRRRDCVRYKIVAENIVQRLRELCEGERVFIYIQDICSYDNESLAVIWQLTKIIREEDMSILLSGDFCNYEGYSENDLILKEKHSLCNRAGCEQSIRRLKCKSIRPFDIENTISYLRRVYRILNERRRGNGLDEILLPDDEEIRNLLQQEIILPEVFWCFASNYFKNYIGGGILPCICIYYENRDACILQNIGPN